MMLSTVRRKVSLLQCVSILLALVLTLFSCATVRAAHKGVTFAAIGDGPREDSDWPLLRDQLKLVDTDHKAAFLVHLGDICKGSHALPEAYYVRVADLLKTSKTPIFIVPGDNEWNDLDNPDQGWQFWTRHFMAFEKNFPRAPRARHQVVRPENFAFERNGVLVIGINLVGGRVQDQAEWNRRHQDDLNWVKENLQAYPGARAAVVCAQARPAERHEDFFAPFCEAAAAFGRPVLYLHGDGHKFEVEPSWRRPNITRVQVDKVGAGPPLLVTVSPGAEQPFRFVRLGLDE